LRYTPLMKPLAILVMLTTAAFCASDAQIERAVKRKQAPDHRTAAQFDAGFVCPEILGYDSQAYADAMASELNWYVTRNKNVTIAQWVDWRMKLLIRHNCTETVRHIQEKAE
jgi:hypothetical protein